MSTMIQVTEPTMVLNEKVCKSNMARMAAKAKAANVVFRPHFKTHQSREIGEWFRASGVDKITVSSLNMAMKFAEWGWNDITVAFPVNCLEHEKINALAAKIRLNLLLVHSEGARQLSECLKYPVGVYLGVDTGYHRDGVDAGNYEKIETYCRGSIHCGFACCGNRRKQPVFHLLFADSGVHATVCDIFRKCKQHDGPFKR